MKSGFHGSKVTEAGSHPEQRVQLYDLQRDEIGEEIFCLEEHKRGESQQKVVYLYNLTVNVRTDLPIQSLAEAVHLWRKVSTKK